MIDIQKEREAFEKHHTIPKTVVFINGEYHSNEPAYLAAEPVYLNMQFKAWLACAESKQAEIEYLKGELNIQSKNMKDRLICVDMQKVEIDDLKSQLKAVSDVLIDDFVLVPKNQVKDVYVAEHLKGTTCSVDVSELTGNNGDRIYGKLRESDCIGSDGNTLIYELESANFKLAKTTGNQGNYILVPKNPTIEDVNAGYFDELFEFHQAVLEARAVQGY